MTTQVRPLSGGAWNSANLNAEKCVRKTTAFGVVLNSAMTAVAVRAMNRWVNCGGAGTAAAAAQEEAKAVGLQLQEV
jgi:hypothetical protein